MTASLEQFKKALKRCSRPIVLGIAGGSGSGKTTLAKTIHQQVGSELCAIIAQDSYYIDQSDKFDGDGGSVNFDHPSSLDFRLLGDHIQALLSGSGVLVPIYDFATHKRRPETVSFVSKPLTIVDGTLILDAKTVRPFLSYSVFVETSEDLRYQRRLDRDVRERGRTPEGVQRQFQLQVKPMHDAFVEPSKTHASLIISGEKDFTQSLEKIYSSIASRL